MDQTVLRRLPKETHPKKGLYGVRYGWWVVICVAYMVSPIDLVPELVLGPLGLADDAGIAAFGIYNLVRWLRGCRSGSAAAPIDVA